MKHLGITDIPSEFLESVGREILNFTVGIVRLTNREGVEDLALLGSGTLIDMDGKLGILTAQHVIEEIPRKNRDIGFLLSEKVHTFAVQTNSLIKIPIGRGKEDAEGPDIGFVLLPQTCHGWIKAHKSFYNIGRRRNEVVQNPPKMNAGSWWISGFPDEYTRDESPSEGFETVKCLHHVSGLGVVSSYCESGDFDYFDFEVVYNERTDPPESFGGVSGGGLWQAIIEEISEGKFNLKELILSGVAFYESELCNNKRILKCHGRRSIYIQAYQTVQRECS